MWLELLDGGPQRSELVAEPHHADLVSQKAKPFSHVELGLERLDLRGRELADVVRRDETFMHENDDSPSL